MRAAKAAVRSRRENMAMVSISPCAETRLARDR
jgi:hypothetical protein